STQQFDIPAQLAPINFIQPSSGPLQEAITTHVTAASSGFIDVTQFKPPPVFAGVLAPDTDSHPVLEAINTTGSGHVDTTFAGTFPFTLFNLTTVGGD